MKRVLILETLHLCLMRDAPSSGPSPASTPSPAPFSAPIFSASFNTHIPLPQSSISPPRPPPPPPKEKSTFSITPSTPTSTFSIPSPQSSIPPPPPPPPPKEKSTFFIPPSKSTSTFSIPLLQFLTTFMQLKKLFTEHPRKKFFKLHKSLVLRLQECLVECAKMFDKSEVTIYLPYTRHHNPLLIINRGF